MNNTQKGELLRKLKPRSFTNLDAIESELHSKKHKISEFCNYKPLLFLDPPIDACSDDSPAIRSIKLQIPIDIPEFERLAVNHEYISKHMALVQELNLEELQSYTIGKNCLPPLNMKKQIFLDLDETLIHCYSGEKMLSSKDIKLSSGNFLSKRPFVDDFISKVSKFYDIIVRE